MNCEVHDYVISEFGINKIWSNLVKDGTWLNVVSQVPVIPILDHLG